MIHFHYFICNLPLLIHFSAKSTALGSRVRGIIYLYIFNPIDFNALLLISQRIYVGHEN